MVSQIRGSVKLKLRIIKCEEREKKDLRLGEVRKKDLGLFLISVIICTCLVAV